METNVRFEKIDQGFICYMDDVDILFVVKESNHSYLFSEELICTENTQGPMTMGLSHIYLLYNF